MKTFNPNKDTFTCIQKCQYCGGNFICGISSLINKCPFCAIDQFKEKYEAKGIKRATEVMEEFFNERRKE